MKSSFSNRRLTPGLPHPRVFREVHPETQAIKAEAQRLMRDCDRVEVFHFAPKGWGLLSKNYACFAKGKKCPFITLQLGETLGDDFTAYGLGHLILACDVAKTSIR